MQDAVTIIISFLIEYLMTFYVPITMDSYYIYK